MCRCYQLMLGVFHRKSDAETFLSLAVPHCADVFLATVPDCSSDMLKQVMAWVGKGLIARQTSCADAALGIRTAVRSERAICRSMHNCELGQPAAEFSHLTFEPFVTKYARNAVTIR